MNNLEMKFFPPCCVPSAVFLLSGSRISRLQAGKRILIQKRAMIQIIALTRIILCFASAKSGTWLHNVSVNALNSSDICATGAAQFSVSAV